MIRLHIVAEGQTEEEFVNSVLVEHLSVRSVFVDVRCVETSRQRAHIFRGGVLDYERAKRDLIRWMKEDDHSECYFSTMFDLFRLPTTFPEYDAARRLADPTARVVALEQAMQRDLGHPRFLPYIQLHEFEALVFVDPSCLAVDFVERADAINELVALAAGFDTPEQIDDGRDTSPSRRIIARIPEYAGRKASAGPRAARDIGLPRLRAKCPHFGDWVAALEELGESHDG